MWEIDGVVAAGDPAEAAERAVALTISG